MIKRLIVLAVLAIALVGMVGAANYMYEKASVKGVGYKNVEMIVSTQTGFNGDKLVEKESGSGNVITEKTELEAERQIDSHCGLCANCIGDAIFQQFRAGQLHSIWVVYWIRADGLYKFHERGRV